MITIRQIADRCGVSGPTVSLILNNKGERYSSATRTRVLQAADEMGYLPNVSARSVARRELSAIGLLVSTTGPRSVFSAMLPGIHEELRQHNLHLTIAELPDAQLTDSGFVPRILREYAVGGFLISYTHDTPPAMIDLVEQHRIPSVWINTKRPHDAVYCDDFHAGYELTRHFLSLGHRRVAYWTHQTNPHYSHADRYAGYVAAMTEAGLGVIDFRSADYLIRDAVASHARALLRHESAPSAVVCYEAPDGVQLRAAAAEMGVQVPQRLSIGVMSGEVPALLGQDLTTFVLPFAQVGKSAVASLLARIAQRRQSLPAVTARGHIVTGQTEGPAPQG